MNEDLSNIKLLDIIDVHTLQKIQDAFSNATGLAALAVDVNGPVTALSNGTEFCTNITRNCSKGAERCNRCDISGGETALRTKKPAVYRCHAGLMDFASPILLGDRQIGSLIGGQVLTKPFNEEEMREIARDLGVDEDNYINAISKVKVVSEEKINSAANLLFIISNTLSNMGYQKYINKKLNAEMIDTSKNIISNIDLIKNNIDYLSNNNTTLTDEFDSLLSSSNESASEIKEIDSVAQYINSVAKQTKLLGINAAIEASKAAQYGASFNIIAKEIRKLSDKNHEQSDKINSILTSVKDNICSLQSQVKETYNTINGYSDILSQMLDTVQMLNDNAKQLSSFEHNIDNGMI